MKKVTRFFAAIMLIVAVVCVEGCHKPTVIFSINASASPSAGGTVWGCGTYEEGQSCTVTAMANNGYQFVNWTEDGTEVSTSASYTINNITADHTLVANFAINSYTICATANPTDGGTVTGAGTYDYGTCCTLTATANEGFVFYYWSADNVLVYWEESVEWVSYDATYPFLVYWNRNYVAHFAMSNDDGHAYVDLGLPSGTLWAICNVGATSPEDYGDYYAWGEIQPKDYYNWSPYQYCNGSPNTLIKYCNRSSYGYNGFTDNLTTLQPEDDAATTNWGAGWRMPTREEWIELYNNTTVTWTTQNGVKGRLFTANNGNTLFLPAAGHRWDDELHYAGIHGYYWSSSLRTEIPTCARSFGFYSDEYSIGWYYRSYGLSVRPVRSAP